jgi:hypothetical protein
MDDHNTRLALARLEGRYPKAWNGTEMFLVGRADENAKVEMTRRCGDGEIVRRYHASPLAEQRKQFGPLFGDGGIEVHHAGCGDKGFDSGSASFGAFAATRKGDTNQKLSIDD